MFWTQENDAILTLNGDVHLASRLVRDHRPRRADGQRRRQPPVRQPLRLLRRHVRPAERIRPRAVGLEPSEPHQVTAGSLACEANILLGEHRPHPGGQDRPDAQGPVHRRGEVPPRGAVPAARRDVRPRADAARADDGRGGAGSSRNATVDAALRSDHQGSGRGRGGAPRLVHGERHRSRDEVGGGLVQGARRAVRRPVPGRGRRGKAGDRRERVFAQCELRGPVPLRRRGQQGAHLHAQLREDDAGVGAEQQHLRRVRAVLELRHRRAWSRSGSSSTPT